MYADRTAAGRALGESLGERRICPDVVLAIGEDGARVARPVADRFDATLGAMATAPVRASDDALPIGAVTDTGHAWVDDRLVEAFAVDDDRLDDEKHRAFREARTGRPDDVDTAPTPEGTVTLVDDGVVTGRAMKACASALSRVETCDVVAATPVGPPEAVAELHAVADAVVVPETTPTSALLEQCYGDG
ncbi:phosphoribosyltransferase [Haloplanus sp. C73]|uniref:phosphoribosyltransferase n=1 Tax=Haloplanus sp. C73 TaxID=3421641 RepID=UPI003EB6E984